MISLGKIFTRRRLRSVAISLLLYEFFFFNIVIPGHNRGAITVDGKHIPDSAACCCCCGGGADSSNTSGQSPKTPSRRDQKNCAICNFAARVVPATFLSLTLPKLGLLETSPLPSPVVPASIVAGPTYHSRGPPQSA